MDVNITAMDPLMKPLIIPDDWPKRLVVHSRLPREEGLLVDAARHLKIPIAETSAKQLERKRFLITRDDLVAGDIPTIVQAMHQLEIPIPDETSYPPVLNPWLKREMVFRPMLGKVLDEIEHRGTPLFIKPAQGWKKFTGHVVYPGEDSWRLRAVSKRIPVWVTAPMTIVSEWRNYVADGEILATCHYSGDSAVRPDASEMAAAVLAYSNSGTAPAGYAIDFCVDSKGQTMLLEVNGGFSVGAYEGCDIGAYWTMSRAYWYWLTTNTTD